MSTKLPRWCLLAAVWCLPGALQAAPDELVESVRVKPAASADLPLPDWLRESQSPFGGMKWSGSDFRPFVFSPDGKQLLTGDAGCWQLECWDVATGKSRGKFGYIHGDVALAFFPDGKTFVAVDQDGRTARVDLWDFEKRKRLRNLDEDVNVIPFRAVAVSPDGITLALGGIKERWIRPDAPKDPGGLRGQKEELKGGAWKTASVPVLHFWDVASGDELRSFDGPPLPPVLKNGNRINQFDALCFAPDGRSLVAALDRKIVLLETATGQQRCILGVQRHSLTPVRAADQPHLPALGFSLDSRTVAIGGENGVVRLWDVMTGKEYAPLVGHSGDVRCLRFLPDGKSLLSFGTDNKLLTWPVDRLKLDWLPKRERLEEKELVALWNALVGKDLLARQVAIRVLCETRQSTLPFLRDQVAKAASEEAGRIQQLLDDLEKEDFGEHKKAKITWATAWDELASEDAGQAFAGMQVLAARPKESVPLLRERLKKAANLEFFDDDPARVAQLIVRLDADDPAAREQASKELARFGASIKEALRKALHDKPSAEAKRRLETLLQNLGKPQPSPERLRTERAL